MKFSFTKSLLLALPVLFLCSCTEEPTIVDETVEAPKYIVCYEAGEMGAHRLSGGVDLLIYPDLVVMNGKAETIGRFLVVNGSIGNILGLGGETLIQNIDLMSLPIEQTNTQAYVVSGTSWLYRHASGQYIIDYESGNMNEAFSGTTMGKADFTNFPIISLTVNGAPFATVAADTLRLFEAGDRCTYTPPPPSSSSVEPIATSSDVGPGPSTTSSSDEGTPTTKSSSSVTPTAKSSSSSTPTSSSSSQGTSGGCPTIKTKGGGGSGWATRYWDCCKPHCSWPEHAGGKYSRQCTNKGKTSDTNWGNGSICDGGGNEMTCISQIPFTIDGCSNMGFAFAAVPASNGGQCGKCFQLTFTGKGKYANDANISAIKDKKLIIMVTNVGTDVEQGQFDIMIPGGGVGIYNGCSSMGWGNQGMQYGGLLGSCEEESNYKPAATLTCLKNKCNSVFSNDAEAKKGCMFLADFMHGAGNPMHNYVEVECPSVLSNKY